MSTTEFDHQTFLSNLTHHPGVYRMYDAGGEVIYVGKAKNLQKRVSSYFRKRYDNKKTAALVNNIANIDVTVVQSETEALILENNFIKQYKPKYNVLLKDDKSYPFIFISNHKHPKISMHRGPQKAQGEYFGPYPSAWSVKESLRSFQKIFQVRQCEDAYYRARSRPCLQYQMQRCSAPCVKGYVTDEEYAEQVLMAKLFLKGKDQQVIANFVKRMEEASQALNFEAAARYRDRISALRKVQEQQWVSGNQVEMDVFGYAYIAGSACVQVLFIRDGKLLGSKSYFPKIPSILDSEEVFASFLTQFYLAADKRIPKEIVVPMKWDEMDVVAQALSAQAGYKIKLFSGARQEKKQYLELANKNADNALVSRQAQQKSVHARVLSLEETLELDTPIQRMECFDISHTSGQQTVASCVVFNRDGPATSSYRRYNIEGITPGDDYAAMAQVLARRYKKKQLDEETIPDIVFIDGGKGQLSQAEAHFADWPYAKKPLLIGVAKGTSRKAGLETLITAYSRETIPMAPDDLGLHLIQHIRDESHRFAITGHRARRQKVKTTSTLESIPGIGAKKRQALLKFMGGLQGLKKASRAEIQKVPGISADLAEIIYDHLHN